MAFGLTLTRASTVVHLDPWWNPAVENQATDRAHRIGQTLPVTVIRLIAQGTLEETMLELHQKTCTRRRHPQWNGSGCTLERMQNCSR